MLDANLQLEQRFSGLKEVRVDDFSSARYRENNQGVKTWFAGLKEDFHIWRDTTKYPAVNDLRIKLTGGRGFNVSYPEEPVHCAIVSENFKCFLQFCVFLNIRYAQQQRILAGKSDSGIPEMVVKGKQGSGGFQCEQLSASLPEPLVPELLVTYMSPDFFCEYHALEVRFYDDMSDNEVDSYLHNMRYFKLLLKQVSSGVKYACKPEFQDLQAAIALLNSAHQPMIGNLRSQSPEFNSKVLKSVISFAAFSLGRDTGLTAFSTEEDIREGYATTRGWGGSRTSDPDFDGNPSNNRP